MLSVIDGADVYNNVEFSNLRVFVVFCGLGVSLMIQVTVVCFLALRKHVAKEARS